MVGVDSEVRYSCPLLSKIVHNGDRVERAQSSGLQSLPRTRERLRMEAECPHSHQLLQAREHQGIHDEALLSQLFITQTSVAVMTSPGSGHNTLGPGLERSRCSVKYEAEPGCGDCHTLGHKSHTERVVVALLFGALIIIFLTLVLSLIYLRETQQQQQYSHSLVHFSQDRELSTEERLVQWGAANNVKIKPGTGTKVTRQEMLGTCQLPKCWSLGRRLMLMSDLSVDPCTSLYDAACGGWVRNVSASRLASRERLDTVSVMDQNKRRIDTKIRDLMLSLEDREASDRNQFVKLKRFYQSCMDISTIKNRGYRPAVEFIRKTFGPYLNPDDSDNGDLTDVIHDILQFGSTALFDVGVDVDPSDNNNIVGVIRSPQPYSHLTAPSLLSPASQYKNRRGRRWTGGPGAGNGSVTSSGSVYEEIQAAADAQKIGKLFSVVENYKILNNYSQPFKQSTTDEIVGFVAALTKMIPGRREEQLETKHNKIYNKYNIAELQSSFRYVNWRSLMRKLFGGAEVQSSQLFLVHFPSFLRQLDRMVSLFGVRWRRCSGLTQRLLPGPASHLYIRSFTEFDIQQMVNKAKEMFKEMRKKAIRQVETTSWLSRQTKSKVMQKLATTKVLVDPPSLYLNQTALNAELNSFNISKDLFFNNVLDLARIRRSSMFATKMMGVNEEVFAWTVAASPLDVNAFRVRQFNSIVLPLGLLASSLLGHNGVPEFVTEGGLGFILGHEIMHSLDHSGRGFDLQGKLALVWDQSSLVRYERKSECLKKSYSSNHKRQVLYRGQPVRLEVDGDFTFDENLCDVEALEMVTDLEMKNIQKMDDLPGVNFTKEQTFFINIAQGYCGLIGSVSQILMTHLSQHSTFRERIDGMMMNSPKFAEAFKCVPGSRMNPARKCGHMFGK